MNTSWPAIVASALFGAFVGMDLFLMTMVRPALHDFREYASALWPSFGRLMRMRTSPSTEAREHQRILRDFLLGQRNRTYILAVGVLWSLVVIVMISAVVSPVRPNWTAGLVGVVLGAASMWIVRRVSE